MSQSLPLISDTELVHGVSSASADDNEAGFGALRTERGQLPLESMDVRGRIDGLLARVTVRQTFINVLDVPLEAAYIFPLPDRAAVTRFRMEVAGREIEGVLEERGQAREHYDRAIAEGRRAAIAEEDRPGVFNLRVGNLMPGDRATVELTLCGVLSYADGEVTFRFPLVVAPRYIPGIPLPGPSVGDGTAVDTNAVPDASRISPPVLLPGFPSPVRLSLEVELHDGGAEIDEVRCSLHAVREESRDGYRRIRLYSGERLNRDFILRFRLGGAGICSTVTLHPDAADGREGTFALTVVPPATDGGSPRQPRDVVFVLDRSGSMEGWKMVAARRAVARMIDTLNEADQFSVLAFDNTVEAPPGLSARLSVASDRHRFRAVEYLAKVRARGGTEMAGPLAQAVELLEQGSRTGNDRVLVLITDGQVGNEDQVLKRLGKRLGGIRVFTLGIDRAVNEGFLRRLAEQGGGSCELVESEDRLDEVMAAVHRRIGTPIMTGLSLSSDELGIEPGEVVPRRLPDLFAGSPLLILGRYRGRPTGNVTIVARDAAGQVFSEPVMVQVRDNPAIAAAWARGQIRQLEDSYAAGNGDRTVLERTIISVSLRFHLLCRFTAYVAVDRSQVVNEGGSLHQITQPVEEPEGWTGPLMIACRPPSQAVRPAPTSGGGGYRGAGGRARGGAQPAPPASTPQHKLDRDRAPRGQASYSSADATPPSAAFDCLSSPTRLSSTPPSSGALPPNPPTIARGERSDFETNASLSMPLPDRFVSLQRIASGAMGQVVKAFDRQRGQHVILEMTPARGIDSQRLKAFQREAEKFSTVLHPALVPILEVDCLDGWLRIVTPAVAGKTLSERLRSEKRMSPREAAGLVAELAEALHLIHGLGLVHGDIKPLSILLGDDGHPRLLDFDDSLLESSRSQPGVIVCTLSYASPERIRDEHAVRGPSWDVYGLGILLYEILTGQLPYDGGGRMELIQKILNETPRAPRRIIRSIPAPLEAICLKAMAKKPDDRYTTAGELAAALRDFLKPGPRRGFWK